MTLWKFLSWAKLSIKNWVGNTISVLITEYFISTFTPHNYSKTFLAEAYGMVTALSEVFAKAEVNVVLTISRYLVDYVKNKNVVITDKDRYLETLKLLKDQVDYVIAIAPPAELIIVAEVVKDRLLGPSVSVIKMLSNKYTTAIALRKCGLKTPKTVICRNSRECNLGRLSYPIIIKPSMLAGAECTYIARNAIEAKELVDIVSTCDPNGYAVVQEYIDGVHGSVSAIYTSNSLQIFSLNLQLIGSKNNKVVYYGNILPIRFKPYVLQALEVVSKLSSCLNSLDGYIGLDIVWNNNGMYIVEANPRFTTSGIGMAGIYPELGKIMLGLGKPRHTYLGEEVPGYVYIIKKVNSENCENVELCIDSLIYGTVNSINEAINAILSLNPSAIQHLLYNIQLIND